MKKRTQLQIFSALTLIVMFCLILIAKLLIQNEDVLIVVSVVILAISALAIKYFEVLMKRERVKEEEQNVAEHREKFVHYLQEHSQDNEMLKAINTIFTGQSLTINDLLNEFVLDMDFDISEEDGFYSIEIVSSVYNRKSIYYSSISMDHGTPYLMLKENDQEIECPLMSEDEIIDALVKDIKKYFTPEDSEE